VLAPFKPPEVARFYGATCKTVVTPFQWGQELAKTAQQPQGADEPTLNN